MEGFAKAASNLSAAAKVSVLERTSDGWLKVELTGQEALADI
jgi:hypothetical protein